MVTIQVTTLQVESAGGTGYYNTSYTTDAATGDTNGNRNESTTAQNGEININYTNVGSGELLVCAGGGAGAGGAGNDGSGPSGFQFGGDGSSTFSETQTSRLEEMLPTTEETVAQAVVAVEAPKVVPLDLLLVVTVTQVVELVVDLIEILLTSLASIISLVVDLQVADNLLQEPMDIFRSLTLTMMEIQTQYLISQQ